uniref:Uncharacterized protein n=1 Tax=Physcomitrium patens TaxID=3218 RepID=A0A2K1JPA2_PHYPA|nr:hypothetical protein PHYPA_015731 [Physcomitrium patens]
MQGFPRNLRTLWLDCRHPTTTSPLLSYPSFHNCLIYTNRTAASNFQLVNQRYFCEKLELWSEIFIVFEENTRL